MSNESLKSTFIPKYVSIGEDKFYRLLLAHAVSKLANLKNKTHKGKTPDLEFLECHDQFLALYRRENDKVCFEIAKCFRRAAHRIYRLMLRQQLTPRNSKFLNLV